MIVGVVNTWLWFALRLISCGWLIWTLRDTTRSAETHRLTVLVLLWSVAPLLLWSWSEGLLMLHYFFPANLGQALVMALFIAHGMNAKGVLPRSSASDNPFRLVLLALLVLAVTGILLDQRLCSKPVLDDYTFAHEVLWDKPHQLVDYPRLKDSKLFYQSSIFDALPNE